MKDIFYILDANNNPVPSTVEGWGEWSKNWARKVVGRTYLNADWDNPAGEVNISTVFLGMDHGWGEGLPVLWETIIFEGEHDQYQERYTSLADAKAGHQKAIELVQSSFKKENNHEHSESSTVSVNL